MLRQRITKLDLSNNLQVATCKYFIHAHLLTSILGSSNSVAKIPISCNIIMKHRTSKNDGDNIMAT